MHSSHFTVEKIDLSTLRCIGYIPFCLRTPAAHAFRSASLVSFDLGVNTSCALDSFVSSVRQELLLPYLHVSQNTQSMCNNSLFNCMAYLVCVRLFVNCKLTEALYHKNIILISVYVPLKLFKIRFVYTSPNILLLIVILIVILITLLKY